TNPGACDVEPPVSKSGPWSRTTMSHSPFFVRKYAALVPTTPAPTMTRDALVSTANSSATAVRVGEDPVPSRPRGRGVGREEIVQLAREGPVPSPTPAACPRAAPTPCPGTP